MTSEQDGILVWNGRVADAEEGAERADAPAEHSDADDGDHGKPAAATSESGGKRSETDRR